MGRAFKTWTFSFMDNVLKQFLSFEQKLIHLPSLTTHWLTVSLTHSSVRIMRFKIGKKKFRNRKYCPIRSIFPGFRTCLYLYVLKQFFMSIIVFWIRSIFIRVLDQVKENVSNQYYQSFSKHNYLIKHGGMVI